MQPRDVQVTREDWAQRVEEQLEARRIGLNALGWSAQLVEVDMEQAVPADRVLELLDKLGWEFAKDEVLSEMAWTTVQRYVRGDEAVAREIADTAIKYAPDSESWEHRNNLGYMLMMSGQFSDAEKQLRSSCERVRHVRDLPHYNLAVCLAQMGQLSEASRILVEVKTRIATERMRDEPVSVVCVLRRPKGEVRLVVEEATGIPLAEAVNRSLGVFS